MGFVGFLSLSPLIPGQTPAAPADLPQNQTIKHELSGAWADLCQIEMPAGRLISIRAEQKDINITLKLLNAAGKRLLNPISKTA